MSLLPQRFVFFLYNRVMELLGLGLLALSVIAGASILSYDPMDPSINTAIDSVVSNYLGVWGALFADVIMQYFGVLFVMPMITLAVWGVKVINKSSIKLKALKLLSSFVSSLLLASSLNILLEHKYFFGAIPYVVSNLLLNSLAGLVSKIAGSVFYHNYGEYVVTFVIISLMLFAVAMFLYSLSLSKSYWDSMVEFVFRLLQTLLYYIKALLYKLWISVYNLIFYGREREVYSNIKRAVNAKKANKKSSPLPLGGNGVGQNKDTFGLVQQDVYTLPAADLLDAPLDSASKTVMSKADMEKRSFELSQVLDDFGVRGEIVSVCPGPVVTLYEFVPAPGIKSSRVISLADDIARSMSAVSARVAVIPGKNALGIELPNEKKKTVFLKNLLVDDDYYQTKAALPLALGQDIGGDPVIADLAKMPHLLMAGTTGSGKSVAVNAMILSLLYKLRPDECKFIMIDPKMLELSIYDGIPHLLTPVVTDPHKAVVALKWAVREMENRYRSMSQMGVRNIDGYNAKINSAIKNGQSIKRTVQTGFDQDGKPIFEQQELKMETIPYIVVVVDEMADLMLVAGKDVEAAIQRLAQMARAAGIHLIMATQRPSVDVITGTIKANFPTRISFQVSSKIDSRTILGEAGAEQLLGQGDMLYMAGGGRTTRVHGPFVRDGEVQAVVDFLKTQGEPEYIDTVLDDNSEPSLLETVGAVSSGSGNVAMGSGNASEDSLIDKAIDIVRRDRKASISYLQRQLKIGYNKSASIVEELEKRGIVTAPNHVGRREVLIPPIGD